MAGLRRTLLAALKSLLRGRSFLEALFTYWIRPSTLKGDRLNGQTASPARTLKAFLEDAESMFLAPIEGARLETFSAQLKSQFRQRLKSHPESMLPSYNHLLPSGQEMGEFLALDVGGSTLRVALVALRGRHAVGQESDIVSMSTFKITPEIKMLEGMAFFDWMAAQILEVLSKHHQSESTGPIPMGMAWSFPVEQTSLGSGLLLKMGKGFLATNGLLGQDLGEILRFACRKQGLDIELAAIINDGSATLLSQAYIHGSTRFGLILGTGTNIAVHLPVSAFSPSKFGQRPDSWYRSANHVIVNTELGMFGGGILPLTRWDSLLSAAHPRPDFQPLEHFLSGYYLGEICRLAVVEAVETTGLLGGVVPPSLKKPYSLDTETLSRLEADNTPNLDIALPYFAEQHPSTVKHTAADAKAIRSIASMVSRRSSALLAAAVHSLWELRHETEAEYIQSMPTTSKSPFVAEAEAENALPHTTVAFNGSVIEKYHSYQAMCQAYIDDMVSRSPHPGSVELVPAVESSILGAAVALACAAEEKNVQ